MTRIRLLRLVRPLATGLVLSMVSAPQVAAADSMADCRSIADDAARLRCFDAAASPSPVAAPAATAEPPVVPPAVVSAPAAAAAPTAPEADFGSRALPKPVPKEPERLQARLLGKLDGVFRGLTLPLDNGQAWLVIDDREFEFVGSNPQVELDRNLIGTYWMKIVNGPRFKVRRVQ